MATLIDDTAQAKKLYNYLKKCRTAVFTAHDGTEYDPDYISPPVKEKRLDPDTNRERMYTIIYIANYNMNVTIDHGIRCVIGSDTWRVTDYNELNGCQNVIAYELILER